MKTSRLITSAGVLALAIAAAAPGAAQAQKRPAFTASQLLSYPFPWSLSTAPAGGGVAWVFNEAGARNLWVALPGPDGALKSRRLTSFTEDDGQDIEHVTWNAAGTTLYYTRNGYGGAHGSGPALSRVTPNNTAGLVSGAPEIELWSVAATGGTPRRIGPGQAPVANPRNGSVAFLNDDQIWLAPAGGGAPKQIVFDRERSEGLTWSPDGEKLAFVSTRNGHRLIGVYTPSSRQIAWVSPTLDNDGEPRWSPDGKKLAFFRTVAPPAGQGGGGGAAATGWSIRVLDVATGQDQQVFAAKPGIGSRFQGFVEGSNLLWAGDRLIFPWEVTGWIRIYSIPASGGEPVALSADGSDVFTANIAKDGKTVVYGGNEGDHDRRHVFQVAPDGATPRRQLTKGTGVEDRPMTTSAGRIVGLRSDPRLTMMPFILEADGSMTNLAQQAIPPEFPAAKLVAPQLITYKTPDGVTVSGQLFIPPGATGKTPAILFHHGGPGNRQMFPAWDPFEVHSRLYAANQYLVARGYIVLSTNYRRGTGYGYQFRNPARQNMPAECLVAGAGNSDYACDIIGAVAYLKSRPEVDADRLGIWGGSNGGNLGAIGAVVSPEFKVAVLYEGGSGTAGTEAMSRWKAPTLMMSTDQGAIVGQTTLLNAVRARGVTTENLVIPNDVHFLMRKASWVKVYESLAGFLDRYLKP